MPVISVVVTSAGLNLIRNSMEGSDSVLIKYVALGTNNATPLVTNTKLGHEVFRKPIASYTNGTTGEIFINGYIAPADAVGYSIAEIGFFGGNSATRSTDSGILLARGLYSHTKANTESIQAKIDVVITSP